MKELGIDLNTAIVGAITIGFAAWVLTHGQQFGQVVSSLAGGYATAARGLQPTTGA